MPTLNKSHILIHYVIHFRTLGGAMYFQSVFCVLHLMSREAPTLRQPFENSVVCSRRNRVALPLDCYIVSSAAKLLSLEDLTRLVAVILHKHPRR